jgi:hypothetical protein
MITNNSKPLVHVFENEQEVVNAVEELKARGIHRDNLYILTHEKERTDRINEKANANTIGANDMVLGINLKSIFQKSGDQLRKKMEEIGLSKEDAARYEEKLDEGKILLFVKDDEGTM